MRVCFVIPTLTAGGAERVVATLANYWSEQGWNVAILVLDAEEHPPAYPIRTDVHFASMGIFDKPESYWRKAIVTIRQVYRLRQAIRAANPQVVISFIDIASLLTGLATLFSKYPIVASERSNPRNSTVNPLLKQINHRFTFRMANGIVVQTNRVKELLSSAVRRKARVIPNPIVVPPRTLGQKELHRRILTIGRLEYEKAHDVLIRAFARIHTVHPTWRLKIVGQGSRACELKDLCEKLGVQSHVEWLAHTENVYEELVCADIFALTSRYEGFPNALGEAMACGLAVVSTDCEFGPRELIEHETNGLLVPVDDVDATAQHLNRLMADGPLRAELGERATRVTTTYAIDKISQYWEQAISDVI